MPGTERGACRAGWELEALGHRAFAVELESDRADATLAQLAQSVAAATPDLDGDVIVVGHSLNGVVIPLVAELRPVSALVFLAALVPQPGVSVNEESRPAAFGSLPARARVARPTVRAAPT